MKTESDRPQWFVDEETDRLLADLDLAMPAHEPPPRLWARIAAGMAAEGADEIRLRFAEGEWRDYAPGIRFKRLWTRETFLLDCQPGSTVPEHEHRSFEHTLVLSGDLVMDGVAYGPGDYLGAPAGRTHALWTTRTGCLVLVHYEPA
jgi:anti-sigma factor ChrR (cupin superfamily)